MSSIHYRFLKIAFEEAIEAQKQGTYPIGAVIVDGEGRIVSRGRNRVFDDNDPTAHAEVDAIRKVGNHLLDLTKKMFVKNDLTLYTTCEPCAMCTCTILFSGIKKVVWAANDNEYGAFRLMKEGPHFLDNFNKLTYEAAPIKKLADLQDQLLNEWKEQRLLLNENL